MSTIYRAIRTVKDCEYTYESDVSMDDALFQIYCKAWRSRGWRPTPLRQSWWQFWRPVERSEFDQRIINEMTK